MPTITDLTEALNAFHKLRGAPPFPCRFCNAEELILRHGRAFTAGRFPYTPVARACFAQSYRFSTRARSRWIYVEGFALRSGVPFPVHHAWLTRADTPQTAYDTAWNDSEDSIYLGIPFKTKYVRQAFHLSGKTQYSVLQAYWSGFPLLTGKDSIEEAMEDMN
jgi:hypothetical protein